MKSDREVQIETIAGKLKQILVEELEVSRTTVESSDLDTPLLGRGIGLDSMETLSLVTGIERTFDIRVADEDMNPRLFQSLRSLSEYVLSRKKGEL